MAAVDPLAVVRRTFADEGGRKDWIDEIDILARGAVKARCGLSKSGGCHIRQRDHLAHDSPVLQPDKTINTVVPLLGSAPRFGTRLSKDFLRPRLQLRPQFASVIPIYC